MAETAPACPNPALSKSESKPKPCCVCKPEKASRDECLLFNGEESGKCDPLIAQYKSCMKGYGFEI